MKSLVEIEAKYEDCRTDKSRTTHNYLQFYERIFSPYRQSATSILEIGVYEGGSHRLWAKYFKNAKIFGIDNSKKCRSQNFPESVKFALIDQTDTRSLEAFSKEHGPFDIVIDDGSHYCAHQILSFNTLWPFIKEGGLYIVEDVLTSYNPRYIEGVTTLEYFSSLLDELNWKGSEYVHAKYPYVTEPDQIHSKYQNKIDYIIFKTNLVIVRKVKGKEELTF